jgi:hypothetical protein
MPKRVPEGGIAEGRQGPIDLGHSRWIDGTRWIGPRRLRRWADRGSGNVADPENDFPYFSWAQPLVEPSQKTMTHHTQLIQPHRVRDVDDQTAVPHGMWLCVLSDFRPHRLRPHTPDVMLAHASFQSEALQRGGDGVRDPHRLPPDGTTHSGSP